MPPQFVRGNVRAPCPGCQGALSTFEYRDHTREFGYCVFDFPETQYVNTNPYNRMVYRILRCAGCGRGAFAAIYCNEDREQLGVLGEFYPLSQATAKIPADVPRDVVRELREAERCASVGAWRAGSALLRSVLEKTLVANGYTKKKDGDLKDRIEAAAKDGLITAARRQRAHENIRVLGNDILHDEWRDVPEPEYEEAHHYAQRILEDFYDHRTEVEKILRGTNPPRLPPAATP